MYFEISTSPRVQWLQSISLLVRPSLSLRSDLESSSSDHGSPSPLDPTSFLSSLSQTPCHSQKKLSKSKSNPTFLFKMLLCYLSISLVQLSVSKDFEFERLVQFAVGLIPPYVSGSSPTVSSSFRPLSVRSLTKE